MPTVITGTEGINQVQTGAVESGDLPAGSVIQVVHTVVRPNITTNSSSPVALGLSASITPQSSSSKFLLTAIIHAKTDDIDSGYGLVFIRDGAEIHTPGGYYEIYGADYTDIRRKSPFQYLDTPNTTSTITYDAQPEPYDNKTVRFGESFFDCNFTIMEIAG